MEVELMTNAARLIREVIGRDLNKRKGLVDMSARNPRIHGTGEPWATLAWTLAGVACAPLAMWIVKALGRWAMGWGA